MERDLDPTKPPSSFVIEFIWVNHFFLPNHGTWAGFPLMAQDSSNQKQQIRNIVIFVPGHDQVKFRC